MASGDLNIERIRSEENEYKLATLAINQISEVAKLAITAIDGHSKSPAVAVAMMEAADGNQ